MNRRGRVRIGRLATGVPGLDPVLGGGLPEYSFNLIAGEPGSGKTTLAQQIMFANASAERPALYFTVLGEPALKMLRYQQQFDFFDPERIDDTIRFVNLSQIVLEQDLNAVLNTIVAEVENTNPRIVVVDSFQTVAPSLRLADRGQVEVQSFVQRLALYLTSWQATTFLIGEYSRDDGPRSAVFTVADGIFWLSQNAERNSIVRKLQVVKLRGQAPIPGLHSFRISGEGVRVFPRILAPVEEIDRDLTRRLGFGVPALDAMLEGGPPVGTAVIVAGPSGSGKSILATQWITAGAARGEPGVLVVFEERPKEYRARARQVGVDLDRLEQTGQLRVVYLRPLDLSVDETLTRIRELVREAGAQRIAIDSLDGFELAVAANFRHEFRESLYRMVGALTATGVTVLMTTETVAQPPDPEGESRILAFLSDTLIALRHVEADDRLERELAVLKMRGSNHSHVWRRYEIDRAGINLSETGNPP